MRFFCLFFLVLSACSFLNEDKKQEAELEYEFDNTLAFNEYLTEYLGTDGINNSGKSHYLILTPRGCPSCQVKMKRCFAENPDGFVEKSNLTIILVNNLSGYDSNNIGFIFDRLKDSFKSYKDEEGYLFFKGIDLNTSALITTKNGEVERIFEFYTDDVSDIMHELFNLECN